MIDTLAGMDSQLLLGLNQFHCGFMDEFMMLFSSRWVWVPMYASLLYLLWRVFPPRAVVVALVAVAVDITLSDQTCATLIRPVVQRLRPSNLQNPLSELVHVVHNYRGGPYGFPSCHAANSFALAVMMSLLLRRRWFTVFIFIWAVLNSYSRIYLGVHYPGDLLAGAVAGSIIAALCYLLAVLLLPALGAGSGERRVDSGERREGRLPLWVGLLTVVVLAVMALK